MIQLLKAYGEQIERRVCKQEGKNTRNILEMGHFKALFIHGTAKKLIM